MTAVDTIAAPALAVRDLRVAIDGASVLSGVTLDVHAGQVAALLGASGSGKTMTALAALDLLPAGSRTDGRIDLGGRPIAIGSHARDPEGLAPARVRGRGIAMIWQHPRASLHPMRTIGDQFREVIRRHRGHGGPARTPRDLLEAAGYAEGVDRLRSFPHELSGGQCQRVAIALALAGRPRVLIADEPTTALDVVAQRIVLERLRALARDEQMAILLVTHDFGVVAEIADVAFVLDGGRVVEAATAADMFDAPRHEATRRLLADIHGATAPQDAPGAATAASSRSMTALPGPVRRPG